MTLSRREREILDVIFAIGGEASAEEIREVVLQAFPAANISWSADRKRQAIVDSWPAEVDDSAARRDWDFNPRYDFTRAFSEYLIPTIRKRYA